MVLPSGLKATLLTLPSFTASGSSTRRLRAGDVPQHHAADADAGAVSGRDGLAVGAEGHAPYVALLHGERRIDQSFARGHVPQHHAADVVGAPYPAAMVLPSGLKATLRRRPPSRGAGASTRRLRPAASHSTTPPPSRHRVSGRDGLAVGAEGHAR